MAEVGRQRAVPHDVYGGAVVIWVVPCVESEDPGRRLSRPCHIGEGGGVDDEDVVGVLVAPIVGGHHADPVHDPVSEWRVAHRVDHDLARCAIEDVLGHRPSVDRGGRLES